jgi:hypothetical protein
MNFYALNATPVNGWETQFGFGQAALPLSASGNGLKGALGSGNAALPLQASGNGTRRVMGAGTVSMALLAEGEGSVVEGNAGKAVMVLSARGVGGITVSGEGAAQMVLTAQGEGIVAKGVFGAGHAIIESRAWDIPKKYETHHGSGTAHARLAASGVGTLIARNGGDAVMALQAHGEGRIGDRVRGSGYASMHLLVSRVQSAQHRQIKAEGVASMEFVARTREHRATTLPAQNYPAPKARILSVSMDNRAIRVPKMARAKELAEA